MMKRIKRCTTTPFSVRIDDDILSYARLHKWNISAILNEALLKAKEKDIAAWRGREMFSDKPEADADPGDVGDKQ